MQKKMQMQIKTKMKKMRKIQIMNYKLNRTTATKIKYMKMIFKKMKINNKKK